MAGRDDGFYLEVEPTTDPRGFRLVGELDVSNGRPLQRALEEAVRQGGDLTLDLAGLAFMDSTGIQILIRTAQGLEESGAKLVLRFPGDLVRRILDLIPVSKLPNVEVVEESS